MHVYIIKYLTKKTTRCYVMVFVNCLINANLSIQSIILLLLLFFEQKLFDQFEHVVSKS